MGFFKLIGTYAHGFFHYYGKVPATLCDYRTKVVFRFRLPWLPMSFSATGPWLGPLSIHTCAKLGHKQDHPVTSIQSFSRFSGFLGSVSGSKRALRQLHLILFEMSEKAVSAGVKGIDSYHRISAYLLTPIIQLWISCCMGWTRAL